MRFSVRRLACIPLAVKACICNIPRFIIVGLVLIILVFAARQFYKKHEKHTRLIAIVAELNSVSHPPDAPYAADDEPFLHLVDKTYKDEDLHEWEPAVYNGTRPGDPGHLGSSVVVPVELQAVANKRFLDHQINVVANEMMSFNRTLPDSRHPNCLSIEYPKKLPQTSVIIIFHNEAFSVLMRTVWNVYSKSPRALVKEIILVDDASDLEELGQKLDDYIKTIPVKVVLLRMETRSGLIQAKNLAAKHVTAPVMTFLDAHMEMNEGWLEPLLTLVAQDRTTIANPIMDQIRYDSMQYFKSGESSMYGMFDWSFIFNWMDIPERERIRTNNDPTAPLRMPAMVGGLFSIDREYFYKLGTYDGGMQIWAGDDIEMSIRTWSCGGSILLAPCSRMGHLTRAKRIHAGPLGWVRLILSNSARFVDVWTDEWSEFFYSIYPQATEWRSDVTERKQLRKKLKCKSFRWYLTNVFPESTLNLERYHFGIVSNTAIKDQCLVPRDVNKLDEPLELISCVHSPPYLFTKRHEIRARQQCLDGTFKALLRMKTCHGKQGTQKFAYNTQTKSFEFNDTGYCLTATNGTVQLKACDGSLMQSWDLKKEQN